MVPRLLNSSRLGIGEDMLCIQLGPALIRAEQARHGWGWKLLITASMFTKETCPWQPLAPNSFSAVRTRKVVDPKLAASQRGGRRGLKSEVVLWGQQLLLLVRGGGTGVHSERHR
ncbi:hypothetical protein NDU88_002663 [Pleurodeles waltl]|uniref:Uncharacterized protein n=1 Tax=Pleurodeles waltl TaxID=8319 RepID=A0AAV7Q7C0_PLEWA|nr:hypothetical protein NDU88_002663 [Pleurodeles waltl]